MPYNTRRVSLSLPSLGIALPNSSRSAAHRSPPTPAATNSDQPPSKKAKRTHRLSSPTPPSPPRPVSARRDERPKSSGRVADNTPPPSPGGEGEYRLDTEGINDDVVVAVIEQLQKTGNRPHSAKELAAVLANALNVVESSANPAAIVASRLTAYVRRRWTALAPCPIAKELTESHPKRIYFYLTTSPHQPLPETAEVPPSANRIITPSLSSAADEEDEDYERDARSRTALSPSPEIDLSTSDLVPQDIAPITPGTSFPGHNPLSQDASRSTANMAHSRRAASPPLERDEREFTQTASSLQQRSRIQRADSSSSANADMTDAPVEALPQPSTIPETEETAALKNGDDVVALFGHSQTSHPGRLLTLDLSSPVLRPQNEFPSRKRSMDADQMEDVRIENALDAKFFWSELKSPENIELEELDAMFGEY